jgi:hypothetical protein
MGVALALPGAPLTVLIPESARLAIAPDFLSSLQGWLSGWLGQMSRSFFTVGLVGVSVGGLLASLRRIFEPREY